jgi:hypothetical protein
MTDSSGAVFDTLEPAASSGKPKLPKKVYEHELELLRAELVKLQSYVKAEGRKVRSSATVELAMESGRRSIRNGRPYRSLFVTLQCVVKWCVRVA